MQNKVIIALVFCLIALLRPAAALAQVATADAEQTYFDFQVEQQVKPRSVRTPVYPERLRSAGVEGQVLVQFVVDESGNAQMSTFKVLKSTDNELTDSVRRAVSGSSYLPAEVRGKKVKQLVQQPFVFAARR